VSAPTPLVLSQVYDVRFVDDAAVEVQADGALYLVGADAEDGEVVIRPDWIASSIVWRMEGHTVLDCLELLQTMRPCSHCEGWRVVDQHRSSDPADVREVECPECDGKGWRS
jgi:DNA polymerase III alpha subunit (gram-positive type)